MTTLFGVNISGLIAEHIGPGVLPATLIVVTPGTVNESDPTAGTTPTETPIGGRGFIEKYSKKQIKGTLVQKGDREIMLIADTFPGLPVPKPTDKIIIEEDTYVIISDVQRDPGAATYLCPSRLS